MQRTHENENLSAVLDKPDEKKRNDTSRHGRSPNKVRNERILFPDGTRNDPTASRSSSFRLPITHPTLRPPHIFSRVATSPSESPLLTKGKLFYSCWLSCNVSQLTRRMRIKSFLQTVDPEVPLDLNSHCSLSTIPYWLASLERRLLQSFGFFSDTRRLFSDSSPIAFLRRSYPVVYPIA